MSKISKYSLSDLYDMASGISSKKEQAGHGAPFVSFGTVFNNYFIPDELPDLMNTSKKEQEIYSIKEDDILITRTSETIDELAMSCVAIKDYPKATYSGFTKRLRPKTKGIVYSKYMAFYLRGYLFRRAVTNNAFMTLRASFNEDIFSFLKLYLPEYKQQVAIGDLLYKIEKKIQLNNKINDNLEQSIRTIFEYWFTQYNFPNASGNSYATTGGSMQYNESLKQKIPLSWNCFRLCELCSLKNGINYDKNSPGKVCYKIINVRNISSTTLLLDSEGFDDIYLSESQAKNYIVTASDIIIARSGTPGATRLILNPTSKTIYCGFIICCTPHNPLHKLYLAYTLKQLEGTNATKTGGSILQNVSQDTLNSINVCLPPDALLHKFNDAVSDKFALMKSLIEENKKLIGLRDWLLPMLMNGQATIED